MYRTILFLTLIGLSFTSPVEALNKKMFDHDLYKKAYTYNPDLANSYYCWKIPSQSFLDFLKIYDQRPIRVNAQGMRSHGNFFLWYLLKEIHPALVIESGVFRGQSTWMIEQAAPDAQIISIDPNPQWREYTSAHANYLTDDFATLSCPQADGPIVCFFDDHINDFERIIQAYEKGIKYLIFDDNYSASTEDEIYHLTLSNCFEMPQFKDKGDHLKKLIKHYYIMPQIIGTTSNHPVSAKIATHIPAIWNSLEEVDIAIKNKMHIFADDSVEYRWITYVELY